MSTAADIHQWESAEIERSIVEAELTPKTQLLTTEWNIARYLDPPADTPYPLEYAFHLVGDVRETVVLDYGCGNGENALPLARKGARVIGLDVSTALLNLAETRLQLNGVRGQATFIAASAHDIPLPDNSVDVVLGIAILHHLDLERASREIHRVLKPGGRAIFKEPVRNSRLLRWVRSLIPYKQEDVSPYERPLVDAEVASFSRRFTRRRQRSFSLPFVNVAQIAPALKKHILSIYKWDGFILRRAPFLKPFATITVFELVKD